MGKDETGTDFVGALVDTEDIASSMEDLPASWRLGASGLKTISQSSSHSASLLLLSSAAAPPYRRRRFSFLALSFLGKTKFGSALGRRARKTLIERLRACSGAGREAKNTRCHDDLRRERNESIKGSSARLRAWRSTSCHLQMN